MFISLQDDIPFLHAQVAVFHSDQPEREPNVYFQTRSSARPHDAAPPISYSHTAERCEAVAHGRWEFTCRLIAHALARRASTDQIIPGPHYARVSAISLSAQRNPPCR